MATFIQQYHEVLSIWPQDPLSLLEFAGRTCYQSECKSSTKGDFIKKILANQHESVIEHGGATVLLVTDRGVTHELVRHRLASYSQESTRYCNYSKDRFSSQCTFILPLGMDGEGLEIWKKAMEDAERAYFALLKTVTPQIARSVLPNSLKTSIVVTANFREWRHIFRLRCSNKAHPQIRGLMEGVLAEIRERVPVLFDDISPV